MGVRWRGTRFDRYFDLMRLLVDGRPTDVVRSTEEAELLDEALVQASQLAQATALIATVDRVVLARKLSATMNGPDLQPIDSSDDMPRNVLFELSVGATFLDHGFSVSMTEEDEDLVVRHVNVPRLLVVECKRPAVSNGPSVIAAFDRNLKRACRQLRERNLAARGAAGVVVLGMDRVYGVARRRVSAATSGALAAAVQTALTEGAASARRRIAASGYSQHVAFGALAFLGLGLAADEQVLYELRSMRLFRAGASKSLATGLASAFGVL